MVQRSSSRPLMLPMRASVPIFALQTEIERSMRIMLISLNKLRTAWQRQVKHPLNLVREIKTFRCLELITLEKQVDLYSAPMASFP